MNALTIDAIHYATGKLESKRLQVVIIQAIATGHDVLGVPTGYGKDLCFACLLRASSSCANKTPLLCDDAMVVLQDPVSHEQAAQSNLLHKTHKSHDS